MLLALFAPVASAEVTILDSDAKEVDVVERGKCKIKGKKGDQYFFAHAKSKTGKFSLDVLIEEPTFQGFDDLYILYFGADDPGVSLTRNSDNEIFSNFKIPGTPAGTVGGGVVRFAKGGKKLGVGLSPASNRSFTESYSFAGYLNCKYPKKKRS